VTKVLDFGVAKRVGPELARESESRSADMTTIDGGLTVTGATVGTVAYMSPEQTRGEVVDSRTDLFSLGAVRFEMVTGVRPFVGETVAEIFRAIRNQSPPPERLAGPIPPTLSKIVRKTLEKERDARYQTAADLRADLEQVAARLERETRRVPKLMAAALRIVFIAGIGTGIWRWSHRARRPPAIRSLAVLPLENLTGDPGQEYFADGMTNALITNLTKVGSLRVISRGSAMTYKGSKKPVAEIARDLNVDAVVEGTVERSGQSGAHQRVAGSRSRLNRAVGMLFSVDRRAKGSPFSSAISHRHRPRQTPCRCLGCHRSHACQCRPCRSLP
jgi:non-specific serine/threonine protein kinase